MIEVRTTLGSAEAARDLARALVLMRLAACAHVRAVETAYVWEGALVEGPEWEVAFLCGDGGYPALERAIRERHPYEEPAIHALAAVAGSAGYLAWVEAGSSGALA